jgi:hypothetical protein
MPAFSANLARLMSHDSKQTKEAACRALRQICVEEGIRGLVVQQGGLKACVTIATDEDCEVWPTLWFQRPSFPNRSLPAERLLMPSPRHW